MRADAAQTEAQRVAGRAGLATRREKKALAAIKAERDGQPIRRMSPLEKRIIWVETNPETWAKPLAEKVKSLNARWPNKRAVTVQQYSQALQDAWFSGQVEGAWKEQARGALPQVIDASIKVASKPSKEGFQDRKLLLGLTGVYNEALEVKGEVGVVHEVGDKLAAALSRAEAARQAALARRRGDDPLVIEAEAVELQEPEAAAQEARDAAARRAAHRAEASRHLSQGRAEVVADDDDGRAAAAQAAAERMVSGVIAPPQENVQGYAKSDDPDW